MVEAIKDILRREKAVTEDDIISYVQKAVPGSKKPGIRAVITKMVNKEELVAVEYKGDTYFLLRSTYERLRGGRS